MSIIFAITAAALTTLGEEAPFAQGTFRTTGGDLPDLYLVYQLISGSPLQHADDEEKERAYRIQVTIYSREGMDELPNVDGAMIAAGFQKGPEHGLPQDTESGHFGLAKEYVYQQPGASPGS